MSVKILFVDNLADTFLSHRLPLAREARHRGMIVEVALPPGPRAQEVEAEGFRIHTLELDRRGLNPFRESETVVALIRLFHKVRPSIVHLRTPKVWTYGGIAARIAGVPAVVCHVTGLGFAHTATGLMGTCARIGLRLLARQAFRHPHQRIIVQNRDDAEVVPNTLGCDPTRIRFIPGSGVDASSFMPVPIPMGIPIVMLPARLLREKGVWEFVEAAQILRRDGISVRCILVGDIDPGNPTSATTEQLQRWQSDGVVEWWGYRRDMAEVLAQATIVCLPSYYREGLPKVLLEAMALARPVIAADSPGTREPVEAGVNGVLVPPKDGPALARAIGALVADLDTCRRMGHEGRRLVVERYSTDIVVRSTLEVIEELTPSYVDLKD